MLWEYTAKSNQFLYGVGWRNQKVFTNKGSLEHGIEFQAQKNKANSFQAQRTRGKADQTKEKYEQRQKDAKVRTWKIMSTLQ